MLHASNVKVKATLLCLRNLQFNWGNTQVNVFNFLIHCSKCSEASNHRLSWRKRWRHLDIILWIQQPYLSFLFQLHFPASFAAGVEACDCVVVSGMWAEVMDTTSWPEHEILHILPSLSEETLETWCRRCQHYPVRRTLGPWRTVCRWPTHLWTLPLPDNIGRSYKWEINCNCVKSLNFEGYFSQQLICID